ncbi:GIY-YIG nuclease family protein [uncultured Oscillibacter sp.]|uniref:GIY-YIG nuclease family protein n=1 Tax=uncultured Oscillibacter sp. TaxID=876091 RepID=UPI002805B82A|nr:GIY-YIG nuclease family protein [uncultured Oscillibacter sp.]
MAWFVYMLRCGDGSLYTGCTDDVARRLAVHQSGRGAKYTRSRLPVALVYRETLPDKSAALRREWEIKRLKRREKLALAAEEERMQDGDAAEGPADAGGLCLERGGPV